MSARNSLLRDPRQLHRGTLPRVVSFDEDIGETKVPADIVACENPFTTVLPVTTAALS